MIERRSISEVLRSMADHLEKHKAELGEAQDLLRRARILVPEGMCGEIDAFFARYTEPVQAVAPEPEPVRQRIPGPTVGRPTIGR